MLTGNSIGPDGVKHLADAMCHINCQLKKLVLWLNKIGPVGARYLAEALCHSNCKLQTLNIGHNSIGDEGAKHLANVISHSGCKLETLNLGRNNISDAGGELFADVLRYDNRALKELGLYDNRNISQELMEKIARLAQINSESTDCSDVEVGRKKRAEYGPSLDEIFGFIRSKPYLLSA